MPFFSLLFRTFALQKSKATKYSPLDAIKILREGIVQPKIESFTIILRLGVDPTKGDHMVRGNVYMPSGTGKRRKIAVFIHEEHKDLAIKLGAKYAGDDLLKQVKEGIIDFEQVLATAEMADALKPYARTLGQRGLMPTTRNGTMIPFSDLEMEMEKLRKGMVNYKMSKSATIQASLGKVRFTDEEIIENFKAFMQNVIEEKPKNSIRAFLKKSYLTTTYGKSVLLDTRLIDPTNAKYILDSLR
ncbi:hypothetical protein SteCoe_12678 [Stentor coeruleus]|uniref:Ribosomal protein n=1 Tax=Stentor coeruleus TaxID=5963 RepID=A0A1R2CA75_9CILI|nr:hypothetical protein SteCoe_12678 [Stentor coeruleus]